MLEKQVITQLKAHMQIIFHYLRKLGASKEEAEDIVQDTMCKTIEYLEGLQDGNLYAWQFKVAINRYYDLVRKRKRIVLQYDESMMQQLYDPKEHTEESVLTTELNQEINQALFKLKDSYRTLLIMKYWLDLSYKEIAEQLDLTESKVKTYLYRARLSFKKIWEGLDGEGTKQGK